MERPQSDPKFANDASLPIDRGSNSGPTDGASSDGHALDGVPANFSGREGQVAEGAAGPPSSSFEPSFEDDSESVEFPVVGVGASAGGLDALEQLFGAMPEHTGMAFVVVQHLSPDFKSVMDELLTRRTRIPVLLVEDDMHVEPDRIYLIPPRKEMIISRGRLLLSDKGESQSLTLPIDIFFRSLAQDMGPRAIGIVLSGAGSDGARGIRDIHDAGGLVLCQDEKSADFDGMPRSARETGVVDHVAPPGEMPRILVDHARTPDRTLLDAFGGNPSRPYGVSAALRFLQRAYGIDFSHYKQSTVLRRIERRLQLTQAGSLEAYVERVASDSEELDTLFHDLLIGVTRFFRDEEAFERLGNALIPELLAQKPKSEEIRVWVSGCATGEEAYSIAILLQEELGKRDDSRRIKILATDVHRGSLDFASRGLYDAERVAGVKPELLARYFDKRGPNYQVLPELRQLVVFAPHNVVKDAPFTRLDLVSCRNMLIYLQPFAQKRVLSLLHFALKRNGILFLGPSETVGALSDDFETIDGHWRIYKKHRDVHLPRVGRTMPRVRSQAITHETGSAAQNYSLAQMINVYDALLEEHVPPSLLVNERRELVHAFAGASRYLQFRDGRTTLDVLEMLEPELRMAATGALQRALKENAAVVYHGLRLHTGDGEKSHRLTVKPVVAANSQLSHFLIAIEETDPPPRSVPSESQLDLSQVSRDQLGSLETELRRTKENLQSTIEELETSNEELQSANEELLAANEELQSTNEELQSVNEELYTVNAEYQKKIRELTELTNDMDNLLASTEVGTIFLDQKLCIRKFTPRVAEVFNLLPQDIGRPLTAFSSGLNHPTLIDDLREVLEKERSCEHEVQDRHGSWYFLRILPYRARGAVDGVVVTLIDINGLKAAGDAVFRERYLLNSLMECVPDATYFKDADGRFVRINRAMARRLELSEPTQAVGKSIADFIRGDAGQALDALDLHALAGDTQLYREEQQLQAGRVDWFMTTRQPLRDARGGIVGMLGVARDVTAQKRAENEIRQAIKHRDEFLAMLSHELRNPLAALVNAAALLHGGGGNASGPQNPGLAVIERQSKQMTRLLDDLLEVSRITQNKIELKKQVIDARDVIEEAVLATRDKFKGHRASLKKDLGSKVVPVEVDPARLQQVVVNLLDNAAKYSRPGGHVALELGRNGDRVVIRVADDGAGIDPGVLESVFDLFVQGRATLDRTEGGMGVGLSVVRSLVEMHGGTISAHSDGVGQGSEFVVELPIAVSSIKPASAARRSSWPPGKRVVVIEDNADGREMLELLLQQAGYQVFSAGDGSSGLELIERERPQIAIVDIGLPTMNGFEIAKALRARPEYQDLYLVALTGYGQPSDHEAALSAGFDEHLVKPLDPNELNRLMNTGD
jgi:two-component system, chemotaxis family, CheB/CheR fusion protein